MKVGFVKDTSELSQSEARLVVGGIPRSGSTLIWQCAKDVFGDGVVKTHGSYCNRFKTICTIRDFRDVAVSYWRCKENPGERRMTDEEQINYGHGILHAVFQIRDYPKDTLFRYEDFRESPERVLLRFWKHGASTGQKAFREIWESHSPENNKGRSSVLASFEEHDPNTQIHGSHIWRGDCGYWKDYAGETLDVILGPSLRRYGYAP